MRTLPSGISAKLAAGVTTLATCVMVKRWDGTILGFTDAPADITFGGTTYWSKAGYTLSNVRRNLGLKADDFEISSAFVAPEVTIVDLQKGIYDRANVTVFVVDWENPTDRFIQLKGHIAEIEVKDSDFTIQVKSMAGALDQNVLQVYSPLCRATLGDARCGVVVHSQDHVIQSGGFYDAFRTTTSATDGKTNADFKGGLIEFLDGPAQGMKIELKEWFDDRWVYVWTPFPKIPQTGNTVRLYVGCDRRFETCRDKFNNAINFRGEPYVPGNTKILRTA